MPRRCVTCAIRRLRVDDPAELAELAGRLAMQSSGRDERRELLFERALLLSDRLEQSAQALGVLHAILELDPQFAPAIEELVALARNRQDYPNLALGLECQLGLTRDPGTRADIAERLATLYEDTLHDEARAHAALRAWNQASPREPKPLRRLRTQIERAGQPRELLGVLDALFACEETPEARIEAALAGAELCATALSDAQGAWQRLSPLVLARDARAERAAHELAGKANLHRPLANAYVMRAQAAGPQLALHDWMQAAALYERDLNEPNEALEAMLRALALDMHNRELLGEINRLAARTQAWDRLARVYGKLGQQAGTEEKIELPGASFGVARAAHRRSGAGARTAAAGLQTRAAAQGPARTRRRAGRARTDARRADLAVRNAGAKRGKRRAARALPGRRRARARISASKIASTRCAT